MSDTVVARTDFELRMLEGLVDCAYALSLAVGEAAKAEADRALQAKLFDTFQRGFLAVRMGIRLAMTLRAAPRALARPAAASARQASEIERPEIERLESETERLQTDRPEPDERERDRDYEPVSLPKFLSTLGVVTREAARLDSLPAHVRSDLLPKLDTLLARAKSPSAAAPAPAAASNGAVALLTRPKVPAKAALLGGAATLSGPPLAFHGKPRPPPYRFG